MVSTSKRAFANINYLGKPQVNNVPVSFWSPAGEVSSSQHSVGSQETPCGGVKDNVDYLRFGNVKFNAQSLKIRYQVTSLRTLSYEVRFPTKTKEYPSAPKD